MIRAIGLFLLLLLKIAGWALLFAVLLLLVVFLLVLFVPIHYDVLALNEQSADLLEKNPVANLQLRLKVNWLLHLVHVTVCYGPDGLTNRIRIAGLDLPAMLAKRAEKKKSGRKSSPGFEKVKKATLEEAGPDEGQASQEKSRTGKEQVFQMEENEIRENPIKENQNKTDPAVAGQIENVRFREDQAAKKKSREAKTSEGENLSSTDLNKDLNKEETKHKNVKARNIKLKRRKRSRNHMHQKPEIKEQRADAPAQGIFSKIRFWYQRVRQEITDEVNRHAFSHLWRELLKLFKSYKPAKLRADLSFSLADPALTGTATGVLSMMPLLYRYPCRIVPDFTSEKLYVEGEILARGRVTIFIFLISVLRLLRDKEFMHVVRRLMKRERA